MGRVLALDIGERRIGVAVSDETGILAQPLAVIQRQSAARDAERVAQLAREHGAETVVVGLPITLRGEQAQAAEKVQAFVSQLRNVLELPIVLTDERLSTVEADRRMREADVRRGERRQSVDAVAAALILERYLSRRLAETHGSEENIP